MHVINISVLSHRNDVLSTKLEVSEAHVCELQGWLDEAKAWLDASEAHRRLSDAMLGASNTHATICNSENQGLHHQLAEKTRMHKKCQEWILKLFKVKID